jgi:phage tail protein X
MRIDEIAVEVYGDERLTQWLIRANPDIEITPILPIDTVIVLPDPPEEEPTGVNLWS